MRQHEVAQLPHPAQQEKTSLLLTPSISISTNSEKVTRITRSVCTSERLKKSDYIQQRPSHPVNHPPEYNYFKQDTGQRFRQLYPVIKIPPFRQAKLIQIFPRSELIIINKPNCFCYKKKLPGRA